MIFCTICKTDKDDDCFYKSTRWSDGKRGCCKLCWRPYSGGISTDEWRATASYQKERAKKYRRERWKTKQ